MASARVVAQAKVNLFLRILAREASGFHQLETLFCRLALGDEVTVRLTSGARSLDCAGEAMPAAGLGPTESNLAWRAAMAFVEATGWSTGFEIRIDKRIPVGGGLGGGSADAGAVLRALNALAPAPLSPGDLLRLAATLGADVPFLTQERSTLAMGWGRGERLLTLPPLPSRPCLVFAFEQGVSTIDAYRWLAEAPAERQPPVEYSPGQLGEWEAVDALSYNEFERVVLPRHPRIARLLDALRHPGLREALPVALMSGSGATVFAFPAVVEPGIPEEALDVLFGIESGDGGGDDFRVVASETASVVEPVRLAD
jgi:4-diphosphocytidyl-2-C-methyl-D-erythritol kinase